MKNEQSRKYISPARERKAAATRNRIMDAAESLLLEKGFAGMTIAAIASKAGVSPQSVYAIFTSKAGIIAAAIEDRVLSDVRNIDIINQLRCTKDPVIILQSIAKLVRFIYEENGSTFKALYGAGMVSPKLAELETELSDIRWERQLETAQILHDSGKLLPHLALEDVRDVLWALTSRELHHLFVVRRGWLPDQYERQLFSMLASSLVQPAWLEEHLRAGTLFPEE